MWTPPPRLLHLLGQAMRTGPARRFARAADDPGAAQAARLTDILGRNADTVYGEIHDFAGIRTPED